jgi:hypothetical protein
MSNNNDETIVVAKKRGRKSKKDIEMALKAKLQSSENIAIDIEENVTENVEISQNLSDIDELITNSNNIVIDNPENSSDNVVSNLDTNKPVGKKRGRKPKGGKIIQQIIPSSNIIETKPNVILHLKCSLKDLQSNSASNNDIQSYDFQNVNVISYDVVNNDDQTDTYNQIYQSNEILTKETINNNTNKYTNSNNKRNDDEYDYDDKNTDKNNDIRDVWKKLKVLENNLHTNNICDKKSACFWCTYEFDNQPIYIPKHFIKDTYHVYGCFCSPECATAYLMEENIDSSSKFERYYHINHIYSKIYDYKKNIKPAPNPYYMLEKYYGNLSIQEYRALLKNERLFLIVDKPLTRILPELHEDNDDFIINNKIIPSNTYQLKNKLKKNNKNSILNEKFGLVQ